MTYLKIGSLLILLIAKSTAYCQEGTVTLSRYHVISLINDALRLDACDSLVVALQAETTAKSAVIDNLNHRIDLNASKMRLLTTQINEQQKLNNYTIEYYKSLIRQEKRLKRQARLIAVFTSVLLIVAITNG
jgi:putative ubiquitin-RnfH superfamily antitoxin RatB of RatAB toxin-antitoxin module